MLKIKILITVAAVILLHAESAEIAHADDFDFLTVGDIVRNVRNNFASFDTYQAGFVMTTEGKGQRTRQTGIIRYKAPDKMLAQFSRPSGQKVVSDGRTMWIYLPSLNVVAEQDLEAEGGMFSAASRSGLNRLFRRYHYRFASKEQPVTRADGSKMYVLELQQKESRAGLRQMTLYINEDYFITRAEGNTASGKKIELTFSDIKTGIDMPDGMFEFDVPARARVIKNPMISEE